MYDITTNQKFDIAIMVIIILNMLTMMFEHYGMSESMKVSAVYLKYDLKVNGIKLLIFAF